jgi:hypothetical protein
MSVLSLGICLQIITTGTIKVLGTNVHRASGASQRSKGKFALAFSGDAIYKRLCTLAVNSDSRSRISCTAYPKLVPNRKGIKKNWTFSQGRAATANTTRPTARGLTTAYERRVNSFLVLRIYPS